MHENEQDKSMRVCLQVLINTIRKTAVFKDLRRRLERYSCIRVSLLLFDLQQRAWSSMQEIALASIDTRVSQLKLHVFFSTFFCQR